MSGRMRSPVPVPCVECGTPLDAYSRAMGLKWNFGPGSGRICSTCHASEGQWPQSADQLVDSLRTTGLSEHWQRALRGDNDRGPLQARHCGHQCRESPAPGLVPQHPGLGAMAMFGPCFVADPTAQLCCRCAGGGAPCSVCAPNIVAHQLKQDHGPKAAAAAIEFLQLHDIVGNTVQVTRAENAAREQRLDSNVVTLYHQTDREAARLILGSQQMIRGREGAAGGGIYFAQSPQDTQRKAHNHGVVLLCRVRLGRVKHLPGPQSDVTFRQLLADSYDSTLLDCFSSGPEWIVYNKDQVASIRQV